MSYSRFIAGLNAAGIEVDRRMLADLGRERQRRLRGDRRPGRRRAHQVGRPDRGAGLVTPASAPAAAPRPEAVAALERGRLRPRGARPRRRRRSRARIEFEAIYVDADHAERARRSAHRSAPRDAACASSRWPLACSNVSPTRTTPQPVLAAVRLPTASNVDAIACDGTDAWSSTTCATPATRARSFDRPTPPA